MDNFSITVNNHRVSYTDNAKYAVPVITFIHGFPFNKFMWKSQVESLRDFYRVITYDIRGFGDSDTGNADFTIELFVKDLVSLLDALKIDKTFLCGLSMGGYIALNAIENYAGRFNALILSDTNCIADTDETKEKRMKTIENIRKTGIEKYADESIKLFFTPESFTKRVEVIASAREMITKTSEKSLSNTLRALSVRKETCSNLENINIPVLIMVGKEDNITPPAAAQSMHEKIHDSLLKIIENAGHLSNIENPEEFNLQLKIFVASVDEMQNAEPVKV